jgi:hypothetical protein
MASWMDAVSCNFYLKDTYKFKLLNPELFCAFNSMCITGHTNL